ncbi:hypothetical protein YC2023_037673 [Brassica napus]
MKAKRIEHSWTDPQFPTMFLHFHRLRRTPLACLKNNRGDFILHLAATWSTIELVRSIVFECPGLLLDPKSKDQLPIHVALVKAMLKNDIALEAWFKMAHGEVRR